MSYYIFEIRAVGTAWGVYFTHPEMLWWAQDDVFETLAEARQHLKLKVSK